MAVRGKAAIYQLSSAASSLTDLGDLPEIRTPEPFVARRKRMQTTQAQILREDSLSGMSARSVSPWGFQFQSLSGRESRGDYEKTTIDILELLVEVRGGGDNGEKGNMREWELSSPLLLGVGYAEGTGGGCGVGVAFGEKTREKMVTTVAEEVRRSGGEVEVNFPALISGRMPEEEVLRPLTALVGWS